MSSLIVVHPDFDATWPFVADHLHALMAAQGPAELIRIGHDDRRTLGQIVPRPEDVTRLVTLAVPVTGACLAGFERLREAAFQATYSQSFEGAQLLAER